VTQNGVPYRGTDGESYLARRAISLSDYVQSLRASLFTDLGRDDRVILDFGCGSGGILSRLRARRRLGIEIGESAAALARSAGIEVTSSLADVPDNSVDVSISFHALEHVECPIDILREIGRVTKPHGVIRLVVPSEMATHPKERQWKKNPDRHLYTWTPLLFGNLAERCGYRDFRTRVEAMPANSRLVKALSPIPPLANLARFQLAIRRNQLNVILDAMPPPDTL
jgi:SAM-dependent methyltransferase